MNSYEKTQNLMNAIVKSENLYEKDTRHNCEELLELSLKNDYSYGKAFAWTHLALYSVFMGEHNETKFYIKKAAELNNKYNFIRLQIECKNILGLYYKSIHDVYMAFSCYLEGIELAKTAKRFISVAMFYNNLALILLGFDDFDSAKTYLLESLQFTNKTSAAKKYLYQRLIYSNLIYIAYIVSNKQEAQKYLNDFNQVPFESYRMEMLTLHNNILVCALDNKKEKVIALANQFLKKLKRYGPNGYAHQCEMVSRALIKIKYQPLAEVILNFLQYNMEKEGRDKLRYLKLKIEYMEAFDINDQQPLVDFYNTVEMLETTENYLLIEGIKSNIEMYTQERDKQSLSTKRSTLENQAELDALTGLYNRRFFNKMISKGNVVQTVESFTCIMIDLDFFKQYNDEYGHLAGDNVLRIVGECLKKNAKEKVYPCRFGGDEFSCLCYALSHEQIGTYIQQVQQSLLEYKIPHIKNIVNPYVTLSFGGYRTVLYSRKKSSFYIKMADEALYQAKKMGRNNYIMLGDNSGV